MNQALVVGGILLMLGGMLGPLYLGADMRAFVAAMLIAFSGIGLILFGAIRGIDERHAACEAKGGTLVRSVCIDRNAVIDIKH